MLFNKKVLPVPETEPFDKYPKELDDLRKKIQQCIFLGSFPGTILSFERQNIGCEDECSLVCWIEKKESGYENHEFFFHISRDAHNDIAHKLMNPPEVNNEKNSQ